MGINKITGPFLKKLGLTLLACFSLHLTTQEAYAASKIGKCIAQDSIRGVTINDSATIQQCAEACFDFYISAASGAPLHECRFMTAPGKVVLVVIPGK